MNKKNQKVELESLKTIIWLFVAVVLIQLIFGSIIFLSFDSWRIRGVFGEMFGAVNTLFAGLAFAGVIYAILLQRKELALQRAELQLTREELRKSAEAQQKSSELLEHQVELMEQAQTNEFEVRSKQAEPILSYNGGSRSGKEIEAKVINKGENIKFPKIKPSLGGYNIDLNRSDVFLSNQTAKITIKSSSDNVDIFPFELHYEDKYGSKRIKKYEFRFKEGLFEINESNEF
ncbi:hypothetical protein [Gracilimonas mengyeensis]|uniref:Uncharacterized protein n=1 Tax=Gracilimonas mengyeensis TaxID=1302730 RepID=A0A521D8Z4_9BACT|nr:hypothetical protein [Gracilimonas mengyeensis]SMO68082.1 hypothetical protein SAMN06265219_107214 [Gracilimonas mengyeensis]